MEQWYFFGKLLLPFLKHHKDLTTHTHTLWLVMNSLLKGIYSKYCLTLSTLNVFFSSSLPEFGSFQNYGNKNHFLQSMRREHFPEIAEVLLSSYLNREWTSSKTELIPEAKQSSSASWECVKQGRSGRNLGLS